MLGRRSSSERKSAEGQGATRQRLHGRVKEAIKAHRGSLPMSKVRLSNLKPVGRFGGKAWRLSVRFERVVQKKSGIRAGGRLPQGGSRSGSAMTRWPRRRKD